MEKLKKVEKVENIINRKLSIRYIFVNYLGFCNLFFSGSIIVFRIFSARAICARDFPILKKIININYFYNIFL